MNGLIDFLFPRFCMSCGCRLALTEKYLCCGCLRELPRTNYHLMQTSPLEQMFWGQIPIERASALFFFSGSNTRGVIHRLKYFNNPQVGEYLAEIMADEFRSSGFFNDIDAIVPIPLAMHRRAHRGYNQSAWIAKGISRQTGIPVISDAVKRIKDNKSQTHLSSEERWENVRGIFLLKRPELIAGKHILLVDDVITTGATTMSCAHALMEAGEGTRFSIAALAVAGEKSLNEPCTLPDLFIADTEVQTTIVSI